MRPFTSVDALEDVTQLDAPAATLSTVADTLTVGPRVRAVLQGEPLGHSAHPVLVQLPIGAWVSAGTLDFLQGTARAATVLTGVGIVSAVPAIAAGLADYRTLGTSGRRMAVVHAAANAASLVCQVLSLRARMRGESRGQWLGLAGTTLLAVGGLLGGHLAHPVEAT